MKSAFTLLAVTLACIGTAQISPAEQPIQLAFEKYRTRAGLGVELSGVETVGGVETEFTISASWFQSIEDGRPMSKVSIEGSRGGVVQYRIVGDGTVLWAWNARRNEYMASRYGNYQGAQPPLYGDTLFNSLRTVAGGHASSVARLFAEVYAGTAANYRTWLPGVTPENTEDVVRYQLGSPVRRSFQFFYSGVTPDVALDKIEFFDSIALRESVRTIEWTATLAAFDVALEEADYQFTPPAGSRAIVGLKPVSG